VSLHEALISVIFTPWYNCQTCLYLYLLHASSPTLAPLPDDLRAQQDYMSFKQTLKTWLFSSY